MRRTVEVKKIINQAGFGEVALEFIAVQLEKYKFKFKLSRLRFEAGGVHGVRALPNDKRGIPNRGRPRPSCPPASNTRPSIVHQSTLKPKHRSRMLYDPNTLRWKNLPPPPGFASTSSVSTMLQTYFIPRSAHRPSSCSFSLLRLPLKAPLLPPPPTRA